MRYALFLSRPTESMGPGDDYFCTIDNFKSMVEQVEQFRGWDPGEYEEFTLAMQVDAACGRAVDIHTKHGDRWGNRSFICIRPFEDFREKV